MKKILDSIVIVACLLAGVTGVFAFSATDSYVNDVRVHMLDVGQGDAFLIESPSGAQMLIDTGPPGKLLEPLQAVMDSTDRYIDVVLLTHPDNDHTGSTPELLERYDIGVIVQSPASCGKNVCSIIDELALAYGVATTTVSFGSQINLGNGVYFDVLWPLEDAGEADNDTSIVGILSYGEADMMFTGDASRSVEEYLVGMWGASLDVEVLKVGHHGSKTATSANFLSATTPTLALISAGLNNSYGHPHADVLTRLIGATDEIIETTERGTATLYSGGIDWLVQN
ncbi:MAG: MBL fold metallo-hydrolase [bacterium]|nr:MBL fold metallo-hydrolase [bacterium]